MGNQLMAQYYVLGNVYNIYGRWDKETPEYEFDFYDIFNEQGYCINEGNPFYTFPSWKKVYEYVEKNNINN